MSFGALLGEVFERSAVALGATAAGGAAEHGSGRLARRFPKVLRVARLGGGAFLVLSGLLWVVTDVVVGVLFLVGSLTLELQGAGEAVGFVVLWLFDLLLGLGAVAWGLRLMYRGWASARPIRVGNRPAAGQGSETLGRVVCALLGTFLGLMLVALIWSTIS